MYIHLYPIETEKKKKFYSRSLKTNDGGKRMKGYDDEMIWRKIIVVKPNLGY